MKHHELKEIFTGRRNIFTVLLTLIGGYFIAYPLVNIIIKWIGYFPTILTGFCMLIIGDYLTDEFHKQSQQEKEKE